MKRFELLTGSNILKKSCSNKKFFQIIPFIIMLLFISCNNNDCVGTPKFIDEDYNIDIVMVNFNDSIRVHDYYLKYVSNGTRYFYKFGDIIEIRLEGSGNLSNHSIHLFIKRIENRFKGVAIIHEDINSSTDNIPELFDSKRNIYSNLRRETFEKNFSILGVYNLITIDEIVIDYNYSHKNLEFYKNIKFILEDDQIK